MLHGPILDLAEVVGLFGSGADVGDVAAATLDASQRGLERAAHDTALVHSFWLDG